MSPATRNGTRPMAVALQLQMRLNDVARPKYVQLTRGSFCPWLPNAIDNAVVSTTAGMFVSVYHSVYGSTKGENPRTLVIASICPQAVLLHRDSEYERQRGDCQGRHHTWDTWETLRRVNRKGVGKDLGKNRCRGCHDSVRAGLWRRESK